MRYHARFRGLPVSSRQVDHQPPSELAERVLGVSRQEAEALIIDCKEQPTQRPSRKQQSWYSGKKKRHTIKIDRSLFANDRRPVWPTF